MLYIHTSDGFKPLAIDPDKYYVTHKFDGFDTLTFEIDKTSEFYKYVTEEVQITDRKNKYIIKNVDEHSDFVTVSCNLNLNDWKSKIFPEFRTTNKALAQVLPLILPEGWVSLGEGTFNKHTTVEQYEGQPLRAVNALEILGIVATTYGCVFNFDTINKRLSCINPEDFKISQEFFTDELNLTDLGYVGNSDNFATRVYAYGKKDETTGQYLTFESINNGKAYVENFEHSKDVISIGVADERYTVKQELMEYALRVLSEVSQPKRSYSCKVWNLSDDFWMYKRVTLIDRVRGKHIVHQVVEYTEYENHINDTITLSRVQPSIISTVFGVKSELSQKFTADLGNLSSDIKSFVKTAIKSSEDKITGNMGGHFIWKLDDQCRPVELFNISDTDDLNTAKKVWRWNASGLAHSNNGVNGNYSLALLDDGSINASQIFTGILNANVIRAGLLTDLLGKNSWNLETGEFNLNAEKLTLNGNPFSSELGKSIKTGARNLYIEKALVYGSLNPDGSLSPDQASGSVVSDFIPVQGSTAIQHWIPNPNLTQFGYWTKLGVYNENREFLRLVDLQDGVSNKKVHTSAIFEPQEGDKYIRVYSSYIEGTKTKVERGTLFTDWTPAPEDVENQITNNYNVLTDQINQQILQLQTTAEGLIAEAIKSRVSNTDFGNFKEEVQSKLKIQADNLTLTFNQLQQGLDEIGGYVTNQQLWLRTSIKGLEIGKIDSEVTTLYTNDALKFMYKGKVVAQFTNDFLEVRNVAVSGQMRYGSQWATRLGSQIRLQNKILGNTLNDVWIGG